MSLEARQHSQSVQRGWMGEDGGMQGGMQGGGWVRCGREGGRKNKQQQQPQQHLGYEVITALCTRNNRLAPPRPQMFPPVHRPKPTNQTPKWRPNWGPRCRPSPHPFFSPLHPPALPLRELEALPSIFPPSDKRNGVGLDGELRRGPQ